MLGNAFLFLGALLLFSAIWSHWELVARMRPPALPPRLARYPSLTVIRPIKGLDCEAEENLRTALEMEYPGPLQILFVLEDGNDPAHPFVERAIADQDMLRGGDSVEILHCGPPPNGRTGKLNAMITGMREATGELIAFIDSDVRSERDSLRIVVETLLTTEDAGSAFASAFISEPPRTMGDVFVAVMLNCLYRPLAARLADEDGGELPFILGQLMVFEHETLRNVVRLPEMRGEVVDDLKIGALIREAGLRNLVAPCSIRLVQYGYSSREAFDLLGRWMIFSRSGIPSWSHKMPLILQATRFLVASVGIVAALLLGQVGAAMLLLASILMGNHTLHRVHQAVGGPPIPTRDWLAPALLLTMLPFLWIHTFFQRSLTWRGRTYALDADSRLAEELGSGGIEGQRRHHGL